MFAFQGLKQANSHSIISVLILLQVVLALWDFEFLCGCLTHMHSQIVSNKAAIHTVQEADSELRIVFHYTEVGTLVTLPLLLLPSPKMTRAIRTR